MKRDIRLELNRYHIEDILLEISNLSIIIFSAESNELSPINNAKVFSYRYGKYRSAKVLIPNWTLVDMAYYAMRNVSDAFTKHPFDRENFIGLIHLFNNHEDRMKTLKNHDELSLYLHGFLGEQNVFQSYYKFQDNYCRERYILDMMYKVDEIDAIVIDEVGVDSNKLPIILFYLFLVCLSSKDILSHIDKMKGIDKNDIEKVILYYSGTLDSFKSSPLKRQQLYTTPFILQKNLYPFPVNVFLIYNIFQNCVFWAVRNYYYKKSSQKFTNAFGEIFQDYVLELLSEYIEDTNYTCIPVAGKSRADFKLTMGKFDLLVEAKGSLAGLNAKQQDSDINSTKKFINNTIIEAATQLKSTEVYYSRKFIKIILVYEEYYKSELLEIALKSDSRFINDGSYWLVNICEFEKLLWIYKEDRALFEEVMNLKVKSEASHSLDGRDLEQILSRCGIVENKHLQQEKYREYFNKVDDYIRGNYIN